MPDGEWLSRAFYIAGNRHQKSFTTAYHADPAALPFTALPISVRIGSVKPDWRSPGSQELASEWADMQVPGNWESRGLPDFDGVVWFTRTVDSTGGDVPAMLSLGPLRNTGEVWVNGQAPDGHAARRLAQRPRPRRQVPAARLPLSPRAEAVAMLRPPTRYPRA